MPCWNKAKQRTFTIHHLGLLPPYGARPDVPSLGEASLRVEAMGVLGGSHAHVRARGESGEARLLCRVREECLTTFYKKKHTKIEKRQL